MFGGYGTGFDVQVGGVVSVWVWLGCMVQVEVWIKSQIVKTFLYHSGKFRFHLKGDKGVVEGF